MYNIGKAVGMNWGGESAGGSGAKTTAISGALKGTFQYSSATYSVFGISSYNTVVSNLNLGEPVLLGGCNNELTILGIPYKYTHCHEWVCDGYIDTQYTTYESLEFHMNWGWGQSYNNYNGWYAYNNWNIPDLGVTYQYADDMVYNIYP